MNKQTDKIQTLRKKVQTLIQNSEYRSVKLYGFSCSRADLEQVEFLCDTLLRQGNLYGFMVYGDVKKIFEKLDIEIKN